MEYTINHEEEGPYWNRVMVNSVHDVLYAAGTLDNFKVSLFSPRYQNEDDEMSVSTITEIIEAEEEGHKAYIFKCKNGKTYLETSLGYTEDQLKNKKTLYSIAG
ncbi:hypothetical protein [Geobacter metallireducens]|uniref:hypothetical protein n=1 Tax=Geobacter metallireducens TaxID=28232 RepID=UPI000053C37A|nr:hypothetical protein [Geobacter metallireducens]